MKSLVLLLALMNLLFIRNAEIVDVSTEDDFDACIIDNDECSMNIVANLILTTEKNITSKSVTLYMGEYSINFEGDNETGYIFDIKESSNFTIILNYSDTFQLLTISSDKNKTGIFNVQNSKFTIRPMSSDNNNVKLDIGNKYVENSLLLSDESIASIQGLVTINGTKSAIKIVDSTISFNELSTEKQVSIFGVGEESIGILSTSSIITINENAIVSGEVGIELYDTQLQINGGNTKAKKISIGDEISSTITAIKFSKKNNISIKGLTVFYGTTQSFLYVNNIEEQEADSESQISFEANKNIIFYSSEYETTFQFNNDNSNENTPIYFNKEQGQSSYTNLTSMEIFGENSDINYDFQIANNLFNDHQVINENNNQLDIFTNSNKKEFLKILNYGKNINSKITKISIDSVDNTDFFQISNVFPEYIFNLNKVNITLYFNRPLIDLYAFKFTSDEKNITIDSDIILSGNDYTITLDFDKIDIYGECEISAVLGKSQYEIDFGLEHTVKINKFISISLDDVTYEETDKSNILIPKNEQIINITLAFVYETDNLNIKEVTANSIDLKDDTVKSSDTLIINIGEKIPKISEDLTFTIKYSYFSNDYEYTFTIKCLSLKSITPTALFFKESTNSITLSYNYYINDVKSFEIVKKDQEEVTYATISEYYYDGKQSSEGSQIYVLNLNEKSDFLGTFYIKLKYNYESNVYTCYTNDVMFTVYTVLEIENLSINNTVEFDKENYKEITLAKSTDISQIYIELNDKIEENRLTIENSLNYKFTYSIKDDNEHIIIIDTADQIGTKFEDSIIITLIDTLDTENKMSFTIKLLELKQIIPNSIELIKNKDTIGEISLVYNMELVNCSKFQLIQYNEEKEEQVKKEIAFENITQEGFNTYTFNITYDDNINGIFYVKTLFDEDYLTFVNNTLTLEIVLKEKEEEKRKTSIVALIVVIILMIVVVVSVILVLFVKRSNIQNEFDKVNKTSFLESDKQLEEKENDGQNDLA